MTGYVFAALLAFVEGRTRWVIVHLGLLAVIVQIHLSGLTLIPVTLMLLLIFGRRVDWRMVGWGVAAAAATLAPFMLYLAGGGGTGVSPLFALTSRPGEFSAEAVSLAMLVMTGAQVHSLAGPQAFRAFLDTIPNLDVLAYFGGGLALVGAGYVLWQWAKRTGRNPDDGLRAKAEAGLVLALWLTLPVLAFVWHNTPIYPHYFIVLFPVPYLLSGILLDAMMVRFPLRGLAVASVLALAVSQVWVVLALWRFVGAQATPGGFGVPLGMMLQTVDTARRFGADEIVIVSDGDSPTFSEIPAVFHVLLRDTPHRFADGRTTTVLPGGKSAVVVWPGAQSYPGEAWYRQWSGGTWRAVVPLRMGEGQAQIAVGRGVSLLTPRPRDASALLSNGAELLGSGGDASRWELWWRAPEGDPAQDYTVFAHLLNAAGERIAQSDVPTYPSANWRSGDLVVSTFALTDSGVVVRAGMYQSASLSPVDVLDAVGSPAGHWLEFPRR